MDETLAYLATVMNGGVAPSKADPGWRVSTTANFRVETRGVTYHPLGWIITALPYTTGNTEQAALVDAVAEGVQANPGHEEGFVAHYQGNLLFHRWRTKDARPAAAAAMFRSACVGAGVAPAGVWAVEASMVSPVVPMGHMDWADEVEGAKEWGGSPPQGGSPPPPTAAPDHDMVALGLVMSSMTV